MDNTNTNGAKGVVTSFSLSTMGFITWLVLLILQLTGAISISWFWVWFPLWIVPAFGLTLFIICLVIYLIFDN